MTNFEKWNTRYEKNWVTKAQLQMLVGLEILTAEEYQTITGEAFVG